MPRKWASLSCAAMHEAATCVWSSWQPCLAMPPIFEMTLLNSSHQGEHFYISHPPLMVKRVEMQLDMTLEKWGSG
jgi:hypothetical protein